MRCQEVSYRQTQCSKTQGGRIGHPRLRCRLAPGVGGCQLTQKQHRKTLVLQQPKKGIVVLQQPKKGTVLLQQPKKGTVLLQQPKKGTVLLQS